jgi:transcriptional regulator with XRE-family HTH domain
MLTYGRQLKAARALAGWDQQQLADAAGVAVNTVRRIEALDGPLQANVSTLRKLQGALEAAGIVFIAENGGGPGVRLRDRS